MTHLARKRFGQNFLHDQNVIQEILACIQIASADHWVEIGPGQGALTEPLLKKAERLDIVELDRDLVALLKNKFNQERHLTIHSADALVFDFSTLAQNESKLRVLGNLPYNISTPLMFHLISYANSISDMHFMLQKEVVDRICASPGNKKYGRLSVMMQYFCAVEPLFEVYPESFDPVPKVMSAVLRLIPHKLPPVQIDNLACLNQVVTQAFSQRRKTLRNSLKKLVPENIFSTLAVDPAVRAEELSLNEFARLSNYLSKTQKTEK